MELLGNDYREVLRAELAKRQDRNPAYSLRAYAKYLGLNPTTLSLVLQGKRTLSEKSLGTLIQNLELDPEQERVFRSMVLAIDGATPEIRVHYARDLAARTSAEVSLQQQEVSVAAFKVISEWYNMALLELLALDSYQTIEASSVVPWVSERLGISETQTRTAFKNLETLGLIELKANKPQRTGGSIRTGDKLPSQAIRSHHRQFLEKGLQALREQKNEECDFSGIIVPTCAEKIPEAKKAIQSFRKKMNEIMNDSGGNEVYRLSVGLFRVTKGNL